MSEIMKPVWRENTKGVVPSNFKPPTKILVRKPIGISVVLHAHTEAQSWSWDGRYLGRPAISAYQTVHIKAAKYERVGCFACRGSGKALAVYESYTACRDCKGHGHTWEPIK